MVVVDNWNKMKANLHDIDYFVLITITNLRTCTFFDFISTYTDMFLGTYTAYFVNIQKNVKYIQYKSSLIGLGFGQINALTTPIFNVNLSLQNYNKSMSCMLKNLFSMIIVVLGSYWTSHRSFCLSIYYITGDFITN